MVLLCPLAQIRSLTQQLEAAKSSAAHAESLHRRAAVDDVRKEELVGPMQVADRAYRLTYSLKWLGAAIWQLLPPTCRR